MAQITTIYPLIIFLLIALDKIHHDHSRGPRMVRKDDWRRERINIEAVEAAEAVTMTFEIDVERSTMQIPGVLGKGAGDKEKHDVVDV
ncbi:hypothetical protein PENSPDRAFT_694590 [Peniophora sp. CONT]|nr:hypothetical protein PENSPDRAFT_694590 [Peniophora sp. CONT]